MKPILFNTEMVQAILQGRKTVTRRVIKGLPQGNVFISWDIENGISTFDATGHIKDLKMRYMIGDILYVREKWQKSPAGTYLYKTDNNGNLSNGHVDKWKPSIHMPKEKARLFLRITNIHVERLQSIRYYEVYQEGINSVNICNECMHTHPCATEQSLGCCCLIQLFKDLWNSTIKKSDKYGWNANPWVCVYGFEVISKDEAMKESAEEL